MKTLLDMNKLKDDLTRDEGRVDEIYIDSLGHKTFGIGHLVTETDSRVQLASRNRSRFRHE